MLFALRSFESFFFFYNSIREYFCFKDYLREIELEWNLEALTVLGHEKKIVTNYWH